MNVNFEKGEKVKELFRLKSASNLTHKFLMTKFNKKTLKTTSCSNCHNLKRNGSFIFPTKDELRSGIVKVLIFRE